ENILIFDLKNNKLIQTIKKDQTKPGVFGFTVTTKFFHAFDPNNEYLVISLEDFPISVCNVKTGKCIRILIDDKKSGPLAFTRDGNYLTFVDLRNNEIVIFEHLKKTNKFKMHKKIPIVGINAIAFNPISPITKEEKDFKKKLKEKLGKKKPYWDTKLKTYI
ncbi:YncE family protein, partial [Candidatus Dependentiae bacterium]